MKLGDKLRSLRKIRGLTQEELGKRVGVTGAYIAMIENGQRKEVSQKIIDRFSQVLGIRKEYFFIEGAVLPQESLPDLSPEILEMLARSESMAFLKLTRKAIDNGISPETVETIIDAIIQAQKKRKGASD